VLAEPTDVGPVDVAPPPACVGGAALSGATVDEVVDGVVVWVVAVVTPPEPLRDPAGAEAAPSDPLRLAVLPAEVVG
jgi:hypothetical protein